MIKYILRCKKNHEFESWFSDSTEFEKLKKKKLLECIYCNSKEISKSIMAPRVAVINEQTKELEKFSKVLKKEKKVIGQNQELYRKKFRICW